MLEETGLPYEPHLVELRHATTRCRRSSCRSTRTTRSRRSSIPTGPDGKPLALFESGAILIYLADKTGQLHAAPIRPRRYETIQWLMFQMGGIGPMFGQVGFFHKFAGKDYEDKRPRDRYVAEVEAPARRARAAARRPRLDHGRRLHHRRHRDLPVGAQPDRLLRGGRAGRHRALPARHARARRVPCAARGRKGTRYPEQELTTFRLEYWKGN